MNENTMIEKTINALRKNYAIGYKRWFELVRSLEKDTQKEFLRSFMLRPTTNYWRIVCLLDNARFAMRTIKIDRLHEFDEKMQRALDLLNNYEKDDRLDKKTLLEKYQVNTYEIGKREQGEYYVQAMFCRELIGKGFVVLSTEFNYKSGERIEVVAKEQGKNILWLYEIKAGDTKTNAAAQVNEYQKSILAAQNVICEMLNNALCDNDKLKCPTLQIKTAVVQRADKKISGVDKYYLYDDTEKPLQFKEKE